MPPDETAESPLERARRRLYASAPANAGPARGLPERAPEPSKGWAPDEQGAPRRARMSFSALFFIIAAGFFVLAGIAAALILFFGARSVSSDRISLTIDGPSSVAGGETAPLFVTIRNENPVDATGVTLSIDFPDGAYSADGSSTPLAHYVQDVGVIRAGQSERLSVKAVFFGAENQRLTLPASVSYRTDNSNATFEKKGEYALTIASSPISISITTLSEVASGQPVTLVASVRSNAPTDLDNVAVRVAYPFGFVPTATSPAAVSTSLFPLGLMHPGEAKELRISGTLSGQDGDDRVFTFSAGVLPSADARELASPVYTTAQASMRLTKSFLGVAVSTNGKQDDPTVISGGEVMQSILSWVNTLSSPITDAQITVALSGNALDPSSISATNGFYRSSNATITYSSDTESGLANLLPGATGNGSFRFAAKSGTALAALRNPTITLSVSVVGRRIGEGNVSGDLTSTLTRTLLVATDLRLAGNAVRSVGPFANQGPWPPEADAETTYTIRWSVANSVNSLADTTVRGTLPPYVRYTGQATPSGAFSYDETTRTVTWTLGDVAPGVLREGAFQVGFTPSASQRGTTPVLVSGQKASGFDRFVQQNVESALDPITIETVEDPGFQSGFGRVK